MSPLLRFKTPGFLPSLLLGLSLTLPALGQPMGWLRMSDDAKSVMIVGAGTGNRGEPSTLTVKANGIPFSTTIQPVPEGIPGQSALLSCRALEGAINTYSFGSRLTPEFEALCIELPGKSARLFIQASPISYPLPGLEDPEPTKRFRRARRHLHLDVVSNDDSQRLYRI